MNTAEKGARYERLCLEEFALHLMDSGKTIVKTWHASRTHFGANDFLGAWDLAILTVENTYWKELYLVQVKPDFSNAEMQRLKSMSFGKSYLAVYNSKPRENNLKTKHFYFVEV